MSTNSSSVRVAIQIEHDKAIADRLNEQYRRIFQTVSCVETAMTAIDAMEDGGADSKKIAAVWGTLELVLETLTDSGANRAACAARARGGQCLSKM